MNLKKKTNSINVICIVQARMNSTRLPGKVLKLILGKPILWYILNSLKRSKTINKIVIATTTSKIDDKVANFANKMKIEVFRGSEKDVLKRYYDAARKYQADFIVRICADCPLIDPKVIDRVIHSALQSNKDYSTNNMPKTYPLGYDVEVFTMNALSKAHKSTKNKNDREHVTLYLERKPNLFSHNIILAPTKYRKPTWRLTVDTPEDLKLIKKIITNLYIKNKHIPINNVLSFLKKNPELLKINSHLEQKSVYRIS